MYRCIAIDDEPLALNILAGYISRFGQLQLVDLTTRPLEGLARVKKSEADLVFLDVQMPGLNGIEFMKAAPEGVKVILTTAYPDYALEGYEYNVVDYLLKPFSFERFKKAVEKLPPKTAPVLSGKPDYLFVKSEYKLMRVDFSDILYLESNRDYVTIHTGSGGKIMTLQPLSWFENELPPEQFLRIHKSYIVALSRIRYIEKNRVVINNQDIPVGDRYKSAFLQRIQAN